MRIAASALALVCLAGCADRGHTRATFDEQTGRLKELAADLNKNGTIDSWTDMDGALPVRARADLDEDGTIDRWEWYDADAKLVKIGFSRRDNGRPDAWAYPDPGGEIQRVDVSSAGDEKAIDRREYYEGGALARTEQDSNRDGTIDQWETYAGQLHALGWRHRIGLREGIGSTYTWFLEHPDDIRREQQEVPRAAVA